MEERGQSDFCKRIALLVERLGGNSKKIEGAVEGRGH